MRLKELRGLPVIDPSAARRIGTVSDYQVDPASGRLAALDINGVEDGDTQRVLIARIRRVGRSAVMLTGRGGTMPGSTPEVVEQWLDSSTLVGLEVMGDDGNLVGQLVDAGFDQDTLTIDAYLLHASLWERLLSRRGRIQPVKVHSCSRELMIVTTGHVKEESSTTATTADTAPLGLTVPLKAEDRVSVPAYEHTSDREPIATNGR